MTTYNVWRKHDGDTYWIAVAEDLSRVRADDIADGIRAAAKRLNSITQVEVVPVGREPQ